MVTLTNHLQLFSQLVNWFMFFCITRTLSNSLETILIVSTLLLVNCNRVFQGNFTYFKAAGLPLPKSPFKKRGTTHSSLSLRHSANKCHNMVVCWSFGLHLYKIEMSISVSWGHSSRVRSHHHVILGRLLYYAFPVSFLGLFHWIWVGGEVQFS